VGRLGRLRLTGAILSFAGLLAAGCGGTEFTTSASVSTTTVASTPASASSARRPAARHASPTTIVAAPVAPVDRPHAPATGSAPASIIPVRAVMGPGWTDDGDPGTSLDITDPPTPCFAFALPFRDGAGPALHEFSYLTSPDGRFERGHVNIAAVRAPNPAAVANELAAVTGPAFLPCAEASAVRRFHESYTDAVDSVAAHPVDLGIGAGVVVWRVDVNWHDRSAGEHTEQMDVVYLGSGNILVKVRVSSCACRPPVNTGELLPGELSLLRAIKLRLAAAS
jgi:hypothetical protein